MYKTISNVVEKSIVGSYDVLENKRYYQPSKNRGIGKHKHSFLEFYTISEQVNPLNLRSRLENLFMVNIFILDVLRGYPDCEM